MILPRMLLMGLVAPALLAAAPATAPEAPADRIFVNGRIWTGDARKPRAEAIALRGEWIAAVGSEADVRRVAGPKTEVVDLKGRFVAPGFNDAHLHFLVVETAALGGLATLTDIQKAIRAYAAANPSLPWIEGRGWVYSAFPGGLPQKKWLDEAVPDRPAVMGAYDGHTTWANSRALAAAGITRDTKDPEGGVIVRDEQGEPTGVLKEAAGSLVRRLVPPHTADQRYRALKMRLDQAASHGLTSVQNASFPSAELPIYEKVIAEGGLTVRFYFAVPFRKNATAEDLARYRALRAKHTGPLFKFGAAKGMLDGVVESRTAAMSEPYVGGGTGHLDWSDEDLFRTAVLYDKEGFQIFLHAIGDRAIHQALNAYAHVAKVNGPRDRRHRVEHIEVPRMEDIPRFKALGVIASTQALFATPDENTRTVYEPALGPERASRAMAFKMLDDAGAVQAFGSDWPVYPMEPLRGIAVAATRTTPDGTPAGGWQPHQRISVEAALRHFTVDSAYASFEEHRKGSLAAGKLADFVVLSDDIFSIAPARLFQTKVLLTVMGGRDTHRAPDF